MADSEYAYNLRKELECIDLALSQMLCNGQEHDIIGSFRFKGVNYGKLQRRRSQLISHLASLNNGKSVVEADFS